MPTAHPATASAPPGPTQALPLSTRYMSPATTPTFSIRNAVNQGVMQHHWFFGNMPPVAGLTPDDVERAHLLHPGGAARRRHL